MVTQSLGHWYWLRIGRGRAGITIASYLWSTTVWGLGFMGCDSLRVSRLERRGKE